MTLPKKIKNATQRGFTLVELIIVIVILGILSAFIIPRFADVATQARVASIEAMAGNMRSAAAMAHAQQVAENGNSSASVVMQGSTVTMTNEYPTEDAAGIGNALGKTNGFTSSTSAASGEYAFTLDKAPTSTTCYASYNAAAANGLPTVSTDTSGC